MKEVDFSRVAEYDGPLALAMCMDCGVDTVIPQGEYEICGDCLGKRLDQMVQDCCGGNPDCDCGK